MSTASNQPEAGGGPAIGFGVIGRPQVRAGSERSSGLPSAHPSASQPMGACLEGSLEPLLHEPTEDLLVPGPQAPRT